MRNIYSGFAIAAMLLASSCKNPYAISLSEIDYASDQTQGTIQITDAKLYSREALVNERKDELTYLDKLLSDSADPKLVKFEPEIIRELETITAFSAALGLGFDPAAGIANEQALERAGLQQELDVLALQLQLDQLKRDAELFREGLDEQEAPSFDTLPTPGSSALTTSNPPEFALDRLNKAIAALEGTVSTRLAATGEGLTPRKTSASVDPSDAFLDRAAYRDLIKSERNAERLDDLHDKNGSALMRFHFGATVLPPTKSFTNTYMDTLGILRMEVKGPQMSTDLVRDVYYQWLSHVNQNLNLTRSRPLPDSDKLKGDDTPPPQISVGETIEIYRNPTMGYLSERTDLITILPYEAPRAEKFQDDCNGWLVRVPQPDKCLYISVAVPPSSTLDTVSSSLADKLEFISNARAMYEDFFRKAAAEIRSTDTEYSNDPLSLDAACRAGDSVANRSLNIDDNAFSGTTVAQALEDAELIIDLSSYLQEGVRVVRDASIENGIAVNPYPNDDKITGSFSKPLQRAAVAYREAIYRSTNRCRYGKDRDQTNFAVPSDFRELLEEANRDFGAVRIYDVAPRQRAQQISTVARAADAISLAHSITGSMPSAGVGVNAEAAFSRSAIGKVDARERAPLVVSFAEPHALEQGPVFDCKVELENHLAARAMDLETRSQAFARRAISRERFNNLVFELEGLLESRQKLLDDFELLEIEPSPPRDVPDQSPGDVGGEIAPEAQPDTTELEELSVELGRIKVRITEKMATLADHGDEESQADTEITDLEARIQSWNKKIIDAQICTSNEAGFGKEQTAFGWLLGPRATLIPDKQKMEFRHHATPYELTADLSLPGWWPYIELETQTAWAPDWNNDQGQTLTKWMSGTGTVGDFLKRSYRVNLSPNAADMAGLTSIIIRKRALLANQLSPNVIAILPRKISACSSKTTLVITGENIWRSEKVIVGGTEFSGNSVRVTPDMSGVMVDVNAGSLPAAKILATSGAIDVVVLTQDGQARDQINIEHVDAKGACSAPKPKPKKKQLKISGIVPDKLTSCAVGANFTIVGENLDLAARAGLGTYDGVTLGAASAGAKSRTFILGSTTPELAKLRGALAGLPTVPLVLTLGDGSVVKSNITVVNPPTCP